MARRFPRPYLVAGPFGDVECDYPVRDDMLPFLSGWKHPRPWHWHEIRKMALERDRWHCVLCWDHSTMDLNVHHRTYDRWGNERLEDVYTLCRACHEKHHGIDERKTA